MSTKKKIEDLVEEHLAEERRRIDRIVAMAECGSPIEELFLMQGLRDGRLSSERWFDAAVFPKKMDVGVSRARLQLLYESQYDGWTGAFWTQAQIGAARVDFAILPMLDGSPSPQVMCRIAVELDGHDFHERTKEQAKRDKGRDRRLHIDGWTVVRFSGSEVHDDAAGCWSQLDELVHSRTEEFLSRKP